MSEEFKFFAVDYPDSPGVYLMKNGRGRIIYVGKAKRLRRRLSSYFQKNTGHTPKTKALVAQVRSVDILLTGTEKEALLLESGLIKKYRPRYNVVLKDDKQYVLFKLDKRSEFPRLSMTRKVVRDGSVYFGPFTSSAAARTTLKLLGKVFPLRKCSDGAFRNRVRPCLYYDIHQCFAPCVRDVDSNMYMEQVHRVEMLLSGKSGELVGSLKKKMAQASADMRFEQAAEYRDQIRAVKRPLKVRLQSFMTDETGMSLVWPRQMLASGWGCCSSGRGGCLIRNTFFGRDSRLMRGRKCSKVFLCSSMAQGGSFRL